jgi:transposase-like protein
MGQGRRRRHTPDLKASVIAQCMRPGVSVAAVALAHSLNANMLRKWVIDAQHNPPTLPPAVSPQEPPPQPAPTFIPLTAYVQAQDGKKVSVADAA